MDARDTGESPFIVSILSTRIRACAGSSHCPLSYVVGIWVVYTVVVGVYIVMCMLCTIVGGVVLFVFISLIKVCRFIGVGVYIVYMCMMYCIGICICLVSSRC